MGMEDVRVEDRRVFFTGGAAELARANIGLRMGERVMILLARFPARSFEELYQGARNGDTFKDLGNEFDISWKKLVKYNDLQRDYTLMEGDIIYLKSKKKKASKPYTVYVVKDGDSMHGISQKYGIRLKNLYKMNRKDGEYVPEIGDRLRLR